MYISSRYGKGVRYRLELNAYCSIENDTTIDLEKHVHGVYSCKYSEVVLVQYRCINHA